MKILKKIFENILWWSGVVVAGLILGISLQLARAWTEPNPGPPGGNLSAPINTSDVQQVKAGVLGVAGLVTNAFQLSTATQNGYVLTSDGSGNASWQVAPGSAAPSDLGEIRIQVTFHNDGGGYTEYAIGMAKKVGGQWQTRAIHDRTDSRSGQIRDTGYVNGTSASASGVEASKRADVSILDAASANPRLQVCFACTSASCGSVTPDRRCMIGKW